MRIHLEQIRVRKQIKQGALRVLLGTQLNNGSQDWRSGGFVPFGDLSHQIDANLQMGCASSNIPSVGLEPTKPIDDIRGLALEF